MTIPEDVLSITPEVAARGGSPLFKFTREQVVEQTLINHPGVSREEIEAMARAFGF